MIEKKKTLVLGASDNPSRYSYLAVNRLRSHGHPVVAIGKKNSMVADVPIEKEKKRLEECRYGNTLFKSFSPATILRLYTFIKT